MVIKGYRVGPLLKKTGREILDDNVPRLAASAAYYFFFSLFPLLLFLAPLLSLVGDKQQMMQWITGQLFSSIPPEAATMVRGVLEQVVYSDNAPGLISIGVVLAAYSGSNVFGNLIGALNTAYDVTEGRPWWRQQLMRLAALGVSGVIVILATVIILAGDSIADWVGNLLNLGPAITLTWKIAQLILALGFLVALAFMTLYMLPNIKQNPWHALIGALVATTLWVLATVVFRLYVQHGSSYSNTYGAIGGVIILLTWMYVTMFVMLTAGELASELHHGTGAVAPTRGELYMGRIVTGAGPGTESMSKRPQA